MPGSSCVYRVGRLRCGSSVLCIVYYVRSMEADGCAKEAQERVGVSGCDLEFETGGSCEEGAEVPPAQDGVSTMV